MSMQVIAIDMSGKKASALDRLNFRWSTRSRLYRLLATRLDSAYGGRLEDMLGLFGQQMTRRKRRGAARITASLVKTMNRDGCSFAKALQPYIPWEEFSLIAAGERHNNLAFVLTLLLDIRERTQRVRKSFRKPLLQLLGFGVLMLGACLAISVLVLPEMTSGSEFMSVSSQKALNQLEGITDFVTGWPLLAILLLTGGTVWAVFHSLSHLTGRLRLVLEYFPPWSGYRNVQGYIWLCNWLARVQAGEKEDLIIREQAYEVSPWLRERLDSLAYLMQHLQFPQALQTSGFNFPSPEMVDEIAVSWGTKGDYSRLFTALKIWANELEEQADMMSRVMGIVFQILIWVSAIMFANLTMKIGI